jgi:hypothetical protein
LKRVAFVIIFVLTACSNQVTAVPTPSQTATIAPLPSPTLTLTLTPITPVIGSEETVVAPEVIKEFPICAPEKFRECEIPMQDILDGTYLAWLKTLPVSVDYEKAKFDVPMMVADDSLIYNIGTAPNFNEPGSAPFVRDATAGYTFIEKDGIRFDYIVLPTFYFDPEDKSKAYPVITLKSVYNPTLPGFKSSDSVVQNSLAAWREQMNITPIVMSNLLPFNDYPDPVVAETFEKFPDMAERFTRFAAGDRSALSEPGIVLLTKFAKNDGHWYE